MHFFGDANWYFPSGSTDHTHFAVEATEDVAV